jgi:hypothetical protein
MNVKPAIWWEQIITFLVFLVTDPAPLALVIIPFQHPLPD